MFSSKFHAALDYIVGFFLIGTPLIFGFSGETAAMLVPVILGTVTIFYSIFTKYEYSLLPLIPYKIHLTIDFISGLLLLASPWLFGFDDRIYLPHLVLGIFEVLAVILSKKSVETVQKISKT